MERRRDVLQAAGLLAATALAGCSARNDGSGTTRTTGETEGGSGTTTTSPASDGPGEDGTGGAALAAAAELNVYRARVYDAVALARADEPEAGAGVAESVFERFEGATGEYGAHEVLERTDREAYEGFERALSDLRDRIAVGNVAGAATAAETAAAHLRDAQVALTDETATAALSTCLFGSRALNAGVVAGLDDTKAAATVADETLTAVEDAEVHGALESADRSAYEGFEGGLEDARDAAAAGRSQDTIDAAREAGEAATDGAYALASDRIAGTGHLAALQARGWDAATAGRLDGPGAGLAHAATLTLYRARLHDARWLATQGETDVASTMVSDVFAHFEGAPAHDPLESAAHDAYEGFETGLEELKGAIDAGDPARIGDALRTVDEHLVAGIEALAGDDAPLLAAAFFRARFGDARERFRRGEGEAAAAAVEDLFARFEADELGFHERVEETSEDLYHDFEETHLGGLQSAYSAGDAGAVETHHAGALDSLSTFLESHAPVRASAAAAASLGARGFDAAVLATLDEGERASTIATEALGRFEAGAAGFHEAAEHADHDAYERFEAALEAAAAAGEAGDPVYPESKGIGTAVLEAARAVVAAGGGGELPAGILADVFGTFETARVHEALESADHGAYEAFEEALGAAREAGGSESATERFAAAARTAQFAVAGAPERAPEGGAGDHGGGHDHGGGDGESDLTGGPNVVDGVPDDADHEVGARPVSFDPETLTVSPGDTVAFVFDGGEPHTVTAYEDELPDGADYWASGDFDSQSAAVEGWEHGEGAIQEGESYVHTFETVGEHGYYCVPHEAAGMVGTIVVEE